MKKKEVTIKDLAEILLPKLWIVVIISIIASGLAFVYSRFFKSDTYTSTSTLYVNSGASTDMATGDNILVASYMLDNYKFILRSENFLKNVVTDLANNEMYKEYRDITANINVSSIDRMMNISHHEDTAIFSISITSSSPELSCVILKAVHLNALDYEKLASMIDNAEYFKLSSVKDPVEPEAHKAIGKNSKHEVRNAVLSFMIAAVVCVVAIWVYSFFDVVIRDKKNLSDNIDVPILGVIPRHDLPITTKGDGSHA